MNKALARDCCCLSCNCVTEESEAQHLHFNFTHSSPLSAPPPHRHTTLRQQNGNSVYLVQGVSAGLFHLPLYLKSKKHLDIYLKLHNTENKHISYYSICRMTGWNNHLQHSAFRLPAAAHDPSQAISISTRWCAPCTPCAMCSFVIHLLFSWFARRGVLRNMSHVEYLETCRMVTLLGIHFLTDTIIILTDHPPSAQL